MMKVHSSYGFIRMKNSILKTVVVSCGSIGVQGERFKFGAETIYPVGIVDLEKEESVLTVFDPKDLMNP